MGDSQPLRWISCQREQQQPELVTDGAMLLTLFGCSKIDAQEFQRVFQRLNIPLEDDVTRCVVGRLLCV